jgi:hypothetical protein
MPFVASIPLQVFHSKIVTSVTEGRGGKMLASLNDSVYRVSPARGVPISTAEKLEMLADEPEGWRHLQEMAQRERNPKRLIEIIDQMNRLLDKHERRASGAIRASLPDSPEFPH